MIKGINPRLKELERSVGSLIQRKGRNIRVKSNRFGTSIVAQPQSKTTAGTADSGVWV